MAILDVNLRHINSVERSIKKTVDELDKRQSDYEGIVKDLNKISSKSGNLSQSNIYLKKKNSQLQDKMNKLNSFKRKLNTFETNADKADNRVADYISDKSETFYKTVGIKTGWAAWQEGAKRKIKKAWEAVKDFYQKHKFVIDFIVDAALLVAAVVSLIAAIPTGGATLFFAGFALANALGDMATSSIALGWHVAGDDEKAGVWAERGLKDGVKWVGKAIGGEIGEKVFGFIYDGLSLASIVYSAGKLGKNLFKSIDLRNTNELSVFQRFTNAGKNILGVGLVGTSGKELASCMQIKVLLGLKSVDVARNIMQGCKMLTNVQTTIKTIDSIYEGTFFESGNKISSTITKTIETIKSMYGAFA